MRLVACIALAVWMTGAVYGQTVSGTIRGTVTDATGLVVPGADIAVKSEQTTLATDKYG
jgi:hypothetical protein